MDLTKLVKKWEAVLEEGHSIRNDKIRRATALMLENQHSHLVETSSAWGTTTMDPQSTGYYSSTTAQPNNAGFTGVGNAAFHKIAVPMVRRTFPELIAHEIVGVQPLTGPVGLAFALRFTAGDATSSGNYAGSTNVELGYNTIDNTYTGTNTYVSGTGPSGTGMTTTYGEGLGSNYTAPGGVGNDIGLGLTTGGGNHIKEVNMTVEKAQVEATTRKLRSRWSLEVAQDLRAMHGLDLEEEMMDVLAYEITAEIDREIIYAIDSIAGTNTWDFNNATQADGRWELEKYRNLYNRLIRESNQIAINTRRGAGNFVVCSPVVCAAFETLSAFTIAPVNADINTSVTGVARIGSLDGRMTVYRDTFQTSNQFICGYKGPSEYDTGIIYLPYIQLLVSRSTFEDSFNPAIGLMSRYAIHRHIFGASNYYRKVRVLNLP